MVFFRGRSGAAAVGGCADCAVDHAVDRRLLCVHRYSGAAAEGVGVFGDVSGVAGGDADQLWAELCDFFDHRFVLSWHTAGAEGEGDQVYDADRGNFVLLSVDQLCASDEG